MGTITRRAPPKMKPVARTGPGTVSSSSSFWGLAAAGDAAIIGGVLSGPLMPTVGGVTRAELRANAA